jgi:predicted aspartyl protease
MSWLPITGALALLGTAAAATHEEPAAPPAPDVLDLAAERFERMTVPVSVMDEGPFRFIVDTGAQATVISLALADRLLPGDRQAAMLVGLNSQRMVQTTSIPRLSLGSRTFPVQTAALVDPFHIGAADGILGLDSLQHQRVLLDFRAGRISIADSEDGGRSGYDIVVRARRKLGQLIIARARIDGVRTAVIIDTGAQGSVGNPELDRRLRRARAMGDSHMTDINGIERTGAVRVARALEIDRARLANLPITFSDSPTFRALGLVDEPALLLGMSELRLFNRVAIDFSTREVLFDLPRDADWPSPSSASRLRS